MCTYFRIKLVKILFTEDHIHLAEKIVEWKYKSKCISTENKDIKCLSVGDLLVSDMSETTRTKEEKKWQLQIWAFLQRKIINDFIAAYKVDIIMIISIKVYLI